MITLIAKLLTLALLLYCSIALILVFSQKPVGAAEENLDFSGQSEQAIAKSQILQFKTRNGSSLNYRQYENESGPLIILVHGSSVHGGLYAELANGLKGLGTIILPDLRGHGGQSPSGDIEYVGQLEDDLADLIAKKRKDLDQKVVLVGHSSGGGLIVRYGGNPHQPKPDGVVLLAPYLGYNSPTIRDNSGGWAEPLTRRIIGLSMLNALKLKFLNHLPVIYFQLPENGEELEMVSSYSYRMNTAFAPRYDFKKDIGGLPKFKVLIGEQDEAFFASEFEPLLNSFENLGDVQVIAGLSHLDVISDNDVHKEIAIFVAELSDSE